MALILEWREREKQEKLRAKFDGRDLHDRLIGFYATHAPEKLSKTRHVVYRVQQRSVLVGVFEAENELNKVLREVPRGDAIGFASSTVVCGLTVSRGGRCTAWVSRSLT
jgi:hypothetical protein